MEHRIALCIGLDHYPSPNNLTNCIEDAKSVAQLLETNGDKSLNFDVTTLTSEDGPRLEDVWLAIEKFFDTPASLRLLYFAGHGNINQSTGSGYLSTLDNLHVGSGIALSDIMAKANQINTNSMETNIVLLDCCQSGAAGSMPGTSMSIISPGVTILAACSEKQSAKSGTDHGIFTKLLLDALGGAAANISGHISPASVYAHIDQSMGTAVQRPVYKANVRHFVSLRHVKPLVELSDLLELPSLFPDPDVEHKLDPSYEHDIKAGHEDDYPVEVRKQNQLKFEVLQKYNRAGLVLPIGHKDMYWAAMSNFSCELTPSGKHYHRLAREKRLR